MGKQSINKGLVFLLVFLIAVGIFIFYSKLTFTGFVTNIPGGSVSSYNLSDGTFDRTKIDDSTTPYAVVVDIPNNYTNGTYVSPFLNVPSNEVVWNNFVPNATLVTNSTVTYFARVCNDDTNCSEDFSSISPGSINLVGKYFQYKVYMEGALISYYNNETNVTSSNFTSPNFYGADMTYLIPIALSIVIDSPQNITYTNESILITISTTNASSVWFSLDGGSNEAYTTTINKTFSQGGHSITVYANDTEHVISKTVSFAVLLPEPYCGDGVCAGAEVCANCPLDCGACQEESESTSSSDLSDTSTCTPDWQCDDWSECVDGTQTRACTDVNACGLAEGMPDGTQSCVVVVQQEDNTPVEQTTTRKGFFSTVGSVITAPVTFVFGNRTRAFIFLGILVLAVAGFFAYKFFLLEGKKFTFNFKKLGKFHFGKFHND